jgi:hypothetical protein
VISLAYRPTLLWLWTKSSSKTLESRKADMLRQPHS